ncbi:MAG: acetoacetate--CoA ligase [Steroidobacteraceae bacterium]|nr:acetoacetate--CoA ligase [Nevskiaceae bacterium]MCP5360490.1 acetoacetate--CoA ligase [Nevskiaceae bacterium]MCP5467558.1 acetoacetate--CoA ligase [Nevskiaceae bacterium]MCP5472836.1 acetoacetate--CoA ligase [Nevskiaceae bacterium]
MDDTPLWRPSAARIAAAAITRFTGEVAQRRGLALPDYAALHRWSIDDPAAFWTELARYAGVVADWGDGPALERAAQMPGARWFPQARLNFAENLLQHDGGAAPALIAVDERGARRELSWTQLRAEVARIAAGLRDCGVVPGDRVAGFMPNLPETVIAMLAASSLGATWSSCSPDFGIHGVLDRFGQIAPKVLFTADGYFYGGKTLDSLELVAALREALPSVRRVVVVPYVGATLGGSRGGGGGTAPALRDRVPFADFGTPGAPLSFTRLPFDHPLYILYSSGTTGMPKCIVHGAGGTLLQHRKEHLLHSDLRRGDRLFYFTTCGWMMWNWLVSGLASGATLVLYEGSPFHPDPGVLWRMAEAEQVDLFGTSAKYLASLEKSDYRPREHTTLTRLRTLFSTGSPLSPESFEFVYRDIKADLQLASISGGTDIVSCFCLGNPVLPVWRGEIQCLGLGMDVRILDAAGQPLSPGQKGELSCANPFPSMPLGLWNDPDGKRFHAAYFERFPGHWHHGDYAALTAHGGIVIHGRSDAVLNPGGVRIGTAEIYRQVETLPEILEALCIGQDWQNDVRIVLFVRLRDDVTLDATLERKIRDTIRRQTTPRHIPAKIVAVPEIPRTRSGKIVELAVRNVVHGRPVDNTDALANPAALEHFRDRPELAS